MFSTQPLDLRLAFTFVAIWRGASVQNPGGSSPGGVGVSSESPERLPIARWLLSGAQLSAPLRREGADLRQGHVTFLVAVDRVEVLRHEWHPGLSLLAG